MTPMLLRSILRLLMLFAFLSAGVRAEEKEKLPAQMPAEIKLTTGGVLRKVSVVRWVKDGVVLKHQGGIDRIQFAFIAAEDRTKVLAFRDSLTAAAAAAAAASPIVEKRIIAGQISTQGADQPYIFTGAQVCILDRTEGQNALNVTAKANWPMPLAVAAADETGAFAVEVPAGDYYLFCTARRAYPNGNQVDYEWKIDLPQKTDSTGLLLSGANAVIKPAANSPGKRR